MQYLSPSTLRLVHSQCLEADGSQSSPKTALATSLTREISHFRVFSPHFIRQQAEGRPSTAFNQLRGDGAVLLFILAS